MNNNSIKNRFDELVWLAYQASSELKELVNTEEFKEAVSLETYCTLNDIVSTTYFKFEHIKDVFDAQVNIVVIAKERLDTNTDTIKES